MSNALSMESGTADAPCFIVPSLRSRVSTVANVHTSLAASTEKLDSWLAAQQVRLAGALSLEGKVRCTTVACEDVTNTLLWVWRKIAPPCCGICNDWVRSMYAELRAAAHGDVGTEDDHAADGSSGLQKQLLVRLRRVRRLRQYLSLPEALRCENVSKLQSAFPSVDSVCKAAAVLAFKNQGEGRYAEAGLGDAFCARFPLQCSSKPVTAPQWAFIVHHIQTLVMEPAWKRFVLHVTALRAKRLLCAALLDRAAELVETAMLACISTPAAWPRQQRRGDGSLAMDDGGHGACMTLEQALALDEVHGKHGHMPPVLLPETADTLMWLLAKAAVTVGSKLRLHWCSLAMHHPPGSGVVMTTPMSRWAMDSLALRQEGLIGTGTALAMHAFCMLQGSGVLYGPGMMGTPSCRKPVSVCGKWVQAASMSHALNNALESLQAASDTGTPMAHGHREFLLRVAVVRHKVMQAVRAQHRTSHARAIENAVCDCDVLTSVLSFL